MFHVVKDRIQDQAIVAKHIKIFCMVYGSICQRFITHFMIMLPAWVDGKPIDPGN
jgi:hypothetical protein